MKIRCLPLATAMALAASSFAVLAQAAAPAPILAASAAPATTAKTGPRLLTPTQSRDSATAPGDLRPERRVTPQLSIPLGKKPVPTSPTTRPKRPPGGAAAGGINDGAARCEAQVDEQQRAKCRDELAREGGKR